MQKPTVSLISAAVVCLSGCSSILGGEGCTAIYEYGIQVEVLDSVSRAPIGRAAVVVARDGAYADTARSPVPAEYQGEVRTLQIAGERPGVYVVEVQRAGYRPWRQTGVRVERDGCHVRPVSLTALLQPTP